MPAASVPKVQWTEEHSLLVLRTMVAQTLASRTSYYTVSGLEEVAEHGGDRVSAKIKQFLKKLCAASGLADADKIVDEEIQKSKGNKGANAGDTNSPKKTTPKKGESGTSKKRKLSSDEKSKHIII